MATNPRNVAARFMLEAMSNLRTRATGIRGAVIWVSSGEFAGADLQHGPRIKIVPGTKVNSEGLNEAASVTLTSPPRVIGALPGHLEKQVIEFVNENREHLLQYWKQEIDTQEMIEGLTPIG